MMADFHAPLSLGKHSSSFRQFSHHPKLITTLFVPKHNIYFGKVAFPAARLAARAPERANWDAKPLMR
jgi:hypothetical protein